MESLSVTGVHVVYCATRGQEVRHMYVQSDTTDCNVVTSHTSEGVGHFQSNSVADCSWQRCVLTARKASFAGEEKT